MSCATEVITRSILYRAGDGSVFYVGARGDSVDSIVVVHWRGVDLCVDCFLDQLDDEERDALELHLRDRGARDV